MHTGYRHQNIDAVYGDLALCRRYLQQWVDNVQGYLAHAGRYHLFRFEEMTRDPLVALRRLNTLLGLGLGQLEQLEAKFSFVKLNRLDSNHFRKGDNAEWQRHFTPTHHALVEEVAGPSMRRVGYSESVEATV